MALCAAFFFFFFKKKDQRDCDVINPIAYTKKGDLIQKLQGNPARPDPNREQLMIPIRVRFDLPQVREPDPTMQPRKEPQMRRMKITESMLLEYGYTEGCEGCRAKAAGMTQKPHGDASRKRMEHALDSDGGGRELRRKNTERENQRIAEKMEKDLSKTGDEPMEQEPELAGAPAASSGGGQEEKMQEELLQEEETAVMKTKWPMEDEEAEAQRAVTSDEQKTDNGSCENFWNDSQMQLKEEGADQRRT